MVGLYSGKASQSQLTAAVAAGARRNKTILLGDSITQQAFVRSGAGDVLENVGYATWLRQLSMQRVNIDIDSEYALNGATTQSIVDDYLASAVSADADFAIVAIGTNDTDGDSIPFTTTVTNLTSIYNALIASGKTVVAVPPLPRTHDNAQERNEHERIVRWVRDYAHNNRGIILADPTKYLVDAASANGEPLSGMMFDEGGSYFLHPAPKGAFYIGKAIWEAMEPWVYPFDIRVHSQGDIYEATYNPRGNLLTNGLLNGTGGTAGTGASGSVADSWTVKADSATGIGTFAAVASKVARTDGESGYWQQIVVSGTPTSTRYFGLTQTVSASGKYVAGDQLEAVCEYQIDTGHSNLRSVELALRDRNSASSTIFTATDGDEFATTGHYVPDPGTMIHGILRTPVVAANNDPGNFVIDANIVGVAGVATSATVRFGKCSVRKVGV